MSDVMAELAKVKAQLAELSAQRSGASQQQPAQQADPQNYTWDQIQKAVQDGEITEATGHQIWAQQQERKAEETARKVAREERMREQTETKLDKEISAYHSKIPDLKTEGSNEAARVQAEFKSLIDMGYGDDKRTALMALSRVYGPAAAIAKPSNQDQRRETHKEGTSGPDDQGASNDDDDHADEGGGKPPVGLTKAQVTHYRRAIDRGIYKDWGAVKEELKFERKRA